MNSPLKRTKMLAANAEKDKNPGQLLKFEDATDTGRSSKDKGAPSHRSQTSDIVLSAVSRKSTAKYSKKATNV